MGFTKLPFAVILEICSYLDVESLIAVADLNREMRNLSLFYKSYWLPSILREGLVLPVPARPLQSFSPQELGLASRRAVFRDRNLSSEYPTLYSSTRISWPFQGLEITVEGTETNYNILPKPLNVSWIPSFHSNGEWYFALSKDFTLRILHVRTAALVLEERLHLSNGEWVMPPSTYSLETVDDFQAKIAVVTPYGLPQNVSEVYIWGILSTYRIALDPERVTASIERVGRILLDVLPKLFDVAGDYAVIVEDDEDWEGSGPIHVVNWKTGEHVRMPPLLYSFAVSGFPDYFISLGVDQDLNVELQVVSLPLQERSLSGSKKGRFGDNHEAVSENSEFVLAGSIPLRSDSEHINLDTSDELAVICHQYTGRTINNIRLWIRDDFHDLGFSVFNVAVDFSKPPKQWFTTLEPLSSEEGEHASGPQYAVEHKRLAAKDDVLQFIVPGTSGKRFFWWKQVPPVRSSDTSLDVDAQLDHSRRVIQLYSADTDSLQPLNKLFSPEDNINEATTRNRMHEESTAYLVREMACPFPCEFPPPRKGLVGLDDSDEEDEDGEEMDCVYSIVSDDWSGTVLITLMCGDLLVLRYGHP